MSNGIYTKFKEGLMNKEYDLDTDVLKLALLSGSCYSVNLASDTTITAASAVGCIIVSGTLAGADLTTTPGTFKATDHVFSAVTSTGSVAQIVIWHSGSGDLIAYFDTDVSGAINIPVNGGDITVDWNASGIFAL
jgi:hypothetical protein